MRCVFLVSTESVFYVLKELALQVCCNLHFEDNTLYRFWRGGVVLLKGFSPPSYLCVYVLLFLYMFFVFMIDCNIIVYIISNQ